jgi:predicted lipoprotein with Yx(FWY)xxD motif
MRRTLTAFALLPAVVALAACGSSGSNSSSSSGGSSTASQSSGATATSPVLRVASKANVGRILVDAQGRTLYRYTPDRNGKSMCTGACSIEWPPATVKGSGPLTAAGAKGTVSTTTRADGTKQLSFEGMPLYRFSQDATTADAKGQGDEHIWFVIPAKGAKTASAPAPSTTTTASRSGYSY